MAKLDAMAVARLLVELGRRTALAGNNYYRSRAYARAAEALATLTGPLERVVDENRLREISGIGDAIAEIISKLHRSGTHPLLERMRKEVPEGVLDMLSIPRVHPDKVNLLYRELGITSLTELEAAARQDRLSKVKGLGAALQRKILQGLAIRESGQGARHVHRAAELIAAAIETLEPSEADVARVVPAGDLRRGRELVRDLAVVAETNRLKGGPIVANEGELSVHLTDAQYLW